ncbi:MAG: helix-turn-helix domain-containing protein [Angustibacter sp.]
MSGIHQPSISAYLAGRVTMSDALLRRLLSCMGFRLEITRRLIRPELHRSADRSWRLHRQLAEHLTASFPENWHPKASRNLARLRTGTSGQPHLRNIDRWEQIFAEEDVRALRTALTGLDEQSIQMREVSPLTGLLSPDERALVLQARPDP